MKFTVHTRSTMPEFQKNEFSVTRLHEDFIWLHDDIRGSYQIGLPIRLGFSTDPFPTIAFQNRGSDLYS